MRRLCLDSGCVFSTFGLEKVSRPQADHMCKDRQWQLLKYFCDPFRNSSSGGGDGGGG